MVMLLVLNLFTFADVSANLDLKSVNECRLEYEVLPCDRSSATGTKTIKDMSKFAKDITHFSTDKKELKCQLGLKDESELKDFVRTEISRLAPQIQKLQTLRNKKSNSAETLAEIDRMENVLKKSSFLSYTTELGLVTELIKNEKVWNPNRLSKEMDRKVSDAAKSLKHHDFPEILFKEMSYNQKNIENCAFVRPSMKSPRAYHFYKILLQNYSGVAVAEAAKQCASSNSSAESCAAPKSERIKTLETEIAEQVCLLKVLSPVVGAQIETVSLEIPSVAGELVTNGPGLRPTEAEAKSKDFRLNVLCPEDLSIGGLVRGALGAGASFATHELSHEGASRVVGKKLKWNTSNGTWSCNDCSDQIKPIAIAGMLSHNVSSELLVRNQTNDSQFQKGWLFFNIFNTSSYFVRDWMARSGKLTKSGFATGTVDKKGAGDLRAFSKNESYLLGALMIGHQVYSGYRYLDNRQDYQCKKDFN